MVCKSKIVGALVIALVMVNIQCVAFCAVESCGTGGAEPMSNSAGVAPCHEHHREAPGSRHSQPCSHQIVPAAVTTARLAHHMTLDNVVAALPIDSSSAFALTTDGRIPAHVLSPPGQHRLSSPVLRI